MTLDNSTTQQGCWIQPVAGEAHYEFWIGMDCLGTLSRSVSEPLKMQARMADKVWIFRPIGDRLMLFDSTEDRSVGAFSGVRDRRGSLVLGDSVFAWSYTHMWLNKWQWNERGQPVMFFRVGLRPRKREADVMLCEPVQPKHPLLLCFGWYLLVYSARDGRGVID